MKTSKDFKDTWHCENCHSELDPDEFQHNQELGEIKAWCPECGDITGDDIQQITAQEHYETYGDDVFHSWYEERGLIEEDDV